MTNNYLKLGAASAAAVATLVPAFAFAATSSTMGALSGAPNVPAAAVVCPNIVMALHPGVTGDAVSSLQSFLANHTSYYPGGLVTGYYGPMTSAAVQRFQAAQGVVTTGDWQSTGYGAVGPRTRVAIGTFCGHLSTGGGSIGGSGSVSGSTGGAKPDLDSQMSTIEALMKALGQDQNNSNQNSDDSDI